MTPRRLIFIGTLILCACGTVQPIVGSEALTDGFPSKPWPHQMRPGKDGRCGGRGPPNIILRGGGCWAWIDAEMAECQKAHEEGDYYVPSEGRCYYPIFLLSPQREPTSSLVREESF